VTANIALVAGLRDEVLGALSERERELAATGRPALSAADEQALGRQLIAEALERRANEALRDQRDMFSATEEDELAHATFDALFRLNRLQRLLDDPSIENINANGCATPMGAGSRWNRSPALTRSWKRCSAPRRRGPG
jgi:pilus assembly protein CpaF